MVGVFINHLIILYAITYTVNEHRDLIVIHERMRDILATDNRILPGNEILITEEICKEQKEAPEPRPPGPGPGPGPPTPVGGGSETGLDKVHMRFQLPKGKVSGIMGVMNLLQYNVRFIGLTETVLFLIPDQLPCDGIQQL